MMGFRGLDVFLLFFSFLENLLSYANRKSCNIAGLTQNLCVTATTRWSVDLFFIFYFLKRDKKKVFECNVKHLSVSRC